MKILIGSPVNDSKEYALEKWLKSVASLRKNFPADFLMIDSSSEEYPENIKKYCQKIGISDYQIEHIDIGKFQPWAEKQGISWELIRKKTIVGGYDAWFSWDSDLIIPKDSIDVLSSVMQSGDYSIVLTNTWSRLAPAQPEASFGCCLISSKVLKKLSFMLTPPENCWTGLETRFKKKVLAQGGSFLELYGTIGPIYHLDK